MKDCGLNMKQDGFTTHAQESRSDNSVIHRSILAQVQNRNDRAALSHLLCTSLLLMEPHADLDTNQMGTLGVGSDRKHGGTSGFVLVCSVLPKYSSVLVYNLEGNSTNCGWFTTVESFILKH